MPVDCSYNPRYYCFGETNKHCVVGVGELITRYHLLNAS